MTRKPGRNDPCWCGSGKKFKKCHLMRASERALPLPALATQVRPFYKAKECLHPEASPEACGQVIGAHSIQRGGPLKKIVDQTGHCLTFYPPDGRFSSKPHRRGWREASTFAGFCDRHDGRTFAPLETTQFNGSLEQVFLLAYRAECHELYQKAATLRAHEPMRQLIDRGMDEESQRIVQEMESWQGGGVQKGHSESVRNKERLDRELLSRDFGGFERLFIRFDGPMSVVSTGAISPNRSFAGRVLQVLHDPEERVQRLYLATVGTDYGGGVILAWRSEDAAIEGYMSELQSIPAAQLAPFLVQTMFAYLENTFFDADWWQSLGPVHREHVRALAQMGNAYYAKWEYLEDLPVPWTNIRLCQEWSRC